MSSRRNPVHGGQDKAWPIVLLACCHCALALNPSLDISQYAHTSWKTRDGFFKGAITSIAQTPDGYLWLGTSTGLVRFDGVRSVPWQPPAGENLPDNYVNDLVVSRDGRVWIATRQGLASWKDAKLTRYPELAGQSVGPLLEDREGTVWASAFGTQSGKLCAMHSGGAHCYGEDGSFGPGVNALYEDSTGNLWAGGLAYLWRWKPGPPKLFRMPDPELSIHGLIEGDDGDILIALRSGIRRLANGRTEALSVPVKQVDPRIFLRDRNGGLWIGTDAGLLHVHQRRTDVFAQSDGLSGNMVARLFEDREGNIWVGTWDGGLDRFRDLAVTTVTVRQGLSSDPVSILAARDGSVWLSTLEGLNRWKDGQVTIYRKGSSGLPDNYVESAIQDERGRIWVFTLRGDAYFEKGRFVRVSGVPSRYIRSIAGDAGGNLWVSHDQALFHLLEGNVVERIPWSLLGRKDWAFSLLPDRARSGLWLGFFQGGLAFFKDGQVREFYAAANGLGEGMVGGLQLDRNGTLWAATYGGLSRLKDGRITTLSSGNGLPCNTVHWVMEDDDHAFWLSTACGLVRIARAELESWENDPKQSVRVRIFDSLDGFMSVPIAGRVAKSVDGRLWFSTIGGVSVIDPHHLPSNKIPPPVHIEQITADRKTYAASSKLHLPPLTRDLEIDYTALSLNAPEKNRFRVKLEGHDRDWQDVGNRRQAFYTDLPPRNYRFRAMASNNSGVWNEAGDSLEFSVAPAYYQTAWFRASCVAAFLALLWGLHRLRLHQMTREFNAHLEGRVDERLRVARELHDTLLQSFHGLLLTFQGARNLLPARVAEASQVLDAALDGAAQSITEARDAVQDLRSSTEITNDLAKAIGTLGEELAAHHGAANGDATAFSLQVEGESKDLHPILRDEISRIAGEALRNAFRHARARRVEAEIRYDARQLRVRVRDDGTGIAASALGQEERSGHFGLRGMRERANHIGGLLEVWSEQGAGTEVQLTVPGSIAYGAHARRGFRIFKSKVGTNS